MKKLMVLVLILAFVSITNAGTVEVMITSLNDQDIDPIKEISVAPSDIVGLSIFYRTDSDRSLLGMSFEVVTHGTVTVDMSQATISTVYDPDISEIILPNGVSAAATSSNGAVDVTIVVDDIIVHPEGGSISIDLVEKPSLPAGATVEIDESWNIFTPDFSGVIVSCGESPGMCWDCPVQPFGDANGDRIVNVHDLIELKRAWGTAEATSSHGTEPGQYNCCADITHDDRVNVFDLIRMKQNWGYIGSGTCSVGYDACDPEF